MSETVEILRNENVRLKLTSRGKIVISILIALLVISISAVAVLFSATSASASENLNSGAQTASFQSHIVTPGDTLWSVAETVAPGEDPRDVIFEIVALNQLPSSEIQFGQELAIPLKYTR